MKSCREPRCSPRVGPVCRETFGVTSRVPSTVLHFKTDLGLLLTRCRGQGPHLGMTGESRGFSQGAAGFSSYDGEFRLPLVLAQEVQSSIQLVRESWGLLSSHFRAKSPHLGLGPGRSIALQGQQGYRGRIPVSPDGSRLVSSGSKGLHYPLESRHVTLGAQ